MATVSQSRKRWLFTWFFAVLPFLGFWLYGLFDLDEGFYGAATAEMNRRGEWVVPYYNGQPWFEKPILLYWFAKPALAVFGDVVGPRVPSVLASLGTLAVVAWFCRRRLSEATAQLAVLILSGSLLFVAIGRMMLTDPLLVLCLTTAFLTFYESLVDSPKWRLVTALALGFSVLAKGPVGLVLFAVLAGWTFYREPDLRPKFSGSWLAGTLIVIAVTCLWYVPVYLARPEGFVQEFIVRQNFGRFAGGDEAHKVKWPGGLIYYLPILFLGLLPWGFWIPKATKLRATDPTVRFLLAWAVIVFVFFTASGSKLPHYILPAVPPLAIVAARYLTERRWAVPLAAGWAALMAIVVNIGFYGWYHGWFPGTPPQDEAHAIAKVLKGMGGEVAVYQMSRRNKSLGTGELKVQETSLPSLIMYLDDVVIETDNLDDLIKEPASVWIITRRGRITAVDQQRMQQNQWNLFNEPQPSHRHYELWHLEPMYVR